MDIELEPGKYVVAVSGGVDSIVLLDMLTKRVMNHEAGDMKKTRDSQLKSNDLIVAHYDHGIRPDSEKDRKLVGNLAKKNGLEFCFEEGKLGPKTSEELARKKRYKFLRRIQKKTKANAIITAHHKDDLAETAIINVIRGTGRKGLSALKSTDEIKRPLLEFDKRQLINYARQNNLHWRDDPTNLDQKYLRNYVRHSVVTKMTARQKAKLLANLNDIEQLNRKIDDMLCSLAGDVFDKDKINTVKFRALPHDLSKELLAHWLRSKQMTFDSRTLERLVVFIKTAKKGTKADINRNHILVADKNFISLRRSQSV